MVCLVICEYLKYLVLRVTFEYFYSHNNFSDDLFCCDIEKFRWESRGVRLDSAHDV